jgi:hypothetical protein
MVRTALSLRGRRDGIGRRGGLPAGREGHREHGAACGAIGRREVTAVGPKDAARNGQTQPRVPGLPIARGFTPAEWGEQVGHIQRVLPDSSPGIQLNEGRVETRRSGEWLAEPRATASLIPSAGARHGQHEHGA